MKQLIHNSSNNYIDERDSITWHSNLPHSLGWKYTIIRYNNLLYWWYLKHSNWFIYFGGYFELKACLINHINNRLHTILGTQLHDIGILIYHMHKYVRDINLLLEFELLYNIEFFIKMEGWIIAKVWL